MSFPEVQPGYRVALSKTKGGLLQLGEEGSCGEDGSSRSWWAPDLATLSEGICHCSLHPTLLPGPTACGNTSTPAATEAGSCKEVTLQGCTQK